MINLPQFGEISTLNATNITHLCIHVWLFVMNSNKIHFKGLTSSFFFVLNTWKHVRSVSLSP